MKNKLSWYSILLNLTSHFVPKEWRFHANYHLPTFLGSYLKIWQESSFSRQCQPYLKGINYSRTKTDHIYYTSCLKNCAKMLLSDVRQMSTNFDNFWHTNSTKVIMWLCDHVKSDYVRRTHFPPHLISVNALPC